MKMQPWLKNLLSALLIIVVGFILFNAAFLFAVIVNRFAMLAGVGFFWHYLNLIIVVILYILIARSPKIPVLVKACLLSWPLIVATVEAGILMSSLAQWIQYLAILGAASAGGFFIFKKKLSWLYYIPILLVAATAIMLIATGMDI